MVKLLALVFMLFVVGFISAPNSYAQATEFTYQGSLKDGANAANGNYDFEFALFDGGGAQIGGTLTRNTVAVANGIFSVSLDFGNQFPGTERLLEIRVRAPGGAMTTLSPRKPILSAPYAIKSLTAATADNSTQLGGVDAARFVRQDVGGNVAVAGGLTVGGTLSLNTVNAATQYNLGGQRILSNAGNSNLFVGAGSGAANSGGFNTFVGNLAGNANTTGDANAFFGAGAGQANTSGIFNSFFGAAAGRLNTAISNSFFGTNSGRSNTTGQQNAFFGTESGLSNVTGSRNAFFGVSSGNFNTADNNAFFGHNAGFNNTTGSGNSVFGYTAGYSNTTGGFNAFFGAVAGGNNTTGSENSFFGDGAGASNVSGSNNTFVGRQAGLNNTASSNAFFGHFAGKTNTTGTGNAFLGFSAGLSNTTGSSNSFFGGGTGCINTTGLNNTFLGSSAGNSNATGSSNTLIGAGANVNTNNLNNASAFGYRALVSADNSLVLGSINGVNSATADTNVGIGTTSPQTRLEIKTLSNNYGFTHTNGPVTFGSYISSEGGWLGTRTNHPLFFFINDGLPRMTVAASGNVGIGTTTPNSRLTVTGLIETTTGGVKFPDGTIQTTAGGGGGGILNQTTLQAGANFNIGSTGTANILNAATQFNLGGQRVLGNPGQNNLFAGIGAGAVTPVLGDGNIENTFFGTSAGQNNIDCCNAFFGNYSGQSNTTGGGNTFLGYNAGTRNTQGGNNTFVGLNSGSSLSTGSGNTFVGGAAGSLATSGANNTFLGQGANLAFGANNLSYAAAIGSGAQVSTNNTIVIGRPVDTVQIPGNLVVSGTFSNPSDARLKQNIQSLHYGLSEVMRLRPVTWQWKTQPTGKPQLGMIAQEVEPVMPELVIHDTNSSQPLTMNYMGFLPVMVKAMQQQQEEIKRQQNQIEALKRLVCQDHPKAEVCR